MGDDLEVNESKLDDLASFDLLDLNWRTVWKSGVQLEGPTVQVGTRVFAAGAALDLGNETFRRQALIWYVLRTAIDRLEQEDSWFVMKSKMAAIYPAHVITGTSYTNGLTRMIYLHQGQPDNDWQPDVVLHEFSHMVAYDHNTGTINWLGAVCSLRGEHPIDLTTHNTQETRTSRSPRAARSSCRTSSSTNSGCAGEEAVPPSLRGGVPRFHDP